MTRWCPDCGDPHECAADAERAGMRDRVEIAKIEANRDVRIAELQAAAVKTEADAFVDVAEAEAGADLAHAEGVADGMETVIDAITPDPPEPADPPVIVDAGGEPEPEPEPEPENAPPVVGVPSAGGGSGGSGWQW